MLSWNMGLLRPSDGTIVAKRRRGRARKDTMKRSLSLTLGAMLVAMGLGSGSAWASSIVLTGHDPDFHAAFGEAGEVIFNQQANQYVMDPAFNSFTAGGINKFLFVESQIAPPGGHTDGLAGLVNSGYVLGTDFDLATAATLNSALDQLGTTYSALVVASDFGGILTQARSEEHTSELQSRPHLVC